MKIDINKIISDPNLTMMAARHLAYSMQDIVSYSNLTPKEREIISEEMFCQIQPEGSRQLQELKAKYPDCIVLLHVGNCYEGREEDARAISRALGITLTRNHGVLFASFPHHALDTYLPKLIRAGHKVAICDQLEPPVQQRSVRITELVSPM